MAASSWPEAAVGSSVAALCVCRARPDPNLAWFVLHDGSLRIPITIVGHAVAAEHLSDLHDLFLVDDHAVGIF